MKKASFNESPIDVGKLTEALYAMYCAEKRQFNLPELKMQVNAQAVILEENVKGGAIKDFLRQLKTIFCADGDSQNQLLIAQFVKESLQPPELEIFMAHVAAISNRIISKKMKEVLYSDLS